MKILIAEDNLVPRKILVDHLTKWGYEIIVTKDGDEAWEVLKEDDAPSLAILDWIMPGKDGTELCRDLRALNKKSFTYIILLTANERSEDIVEGLNSGADDYITKPFNSSELKSRVQAGIRIIELEEKLQNKIGELETALNEIKTLEGILPMCAWCKKVRDDSNYWHQVEEYIKARSNTEISHGICPDCYDSYLEENDLNDEPDEKKKEETTTK